VIIGKVPVRGRAGGIDWCSMGARSAGFSTLPLLTKTRAAGLATMTRGGVPGSWPEAAPIGPVPTFAVAGWMGSPEDGASLGECSRAGTMPVSGGALVVAKVAWSGAVLERLVAPLRGGAAGRGLSGVGRTRGSVLAREVEPLREAECFNGVGETRPVGGRIVFCMGWVTAVDQAGGMFCDPAGVSLFDVRIGSVAAVGLGGRGPSCMESGFSGRGGKVTRNVSRL
jgi:hypothetical protein